MSEPIERLLVEPSRQADAAVIWLHGLGADGHDFEGIVPHLGLPDGHGVRFVFPHAPVRPVTVNGGMEMRAWYDIVEMNIGIRQDEAGIRNSAGLAASLIAAESSAGISPERIVLAGFSQGGAIALHAGLRHPERLAGIMALSTYLPLAESLDAERSQPNAQVPIFMAHGTADPVIPFRLADESRKRLERTGYAVDFRSYPMPHSVVPEEIADIGTWLRAILPANGGQS